MISYEGLLQKLNKGNNFPVSLPRRGKNAEKTRKKQAIFADENPGFRKPVI